MPRAWDLAFGTDPIRLAENGNLLPRDVELVDLPDGVACHHRGCLSHVTHPCEGCGRVGGRPDRRPILVGEANPYGGDPRMALYPDPENSAGGRLCRLVMGLEPRDYLRRFDRRNLCPEKWSMKVAREAAVAITREVAEMGRVAVLFGAKVAEAFYAPFVPFTIERRPFAGALNPFTFVLLPHPSGLSRAWNVPGAYDRARAVLREAGVLS